MILINELDLEKSFEKLKAQFAESEKAKQEGRFGYANAYIGLSVAVQRHLKECIGGEPVNIPAADPNDLNQVNI